MISNDLIWWVSAINLPALTGLFWLIWRNKRDSEIALHHMRDTLERRSAQLRDALNGFKLEVAKNYASQTDMRDLEQRLVRHLLRIESKLDATALKTEAVHAAKNLEA